MKRRDPIVQVIIPPPVPGRVIRPPARPLNPEAGRMKAGNLKSRRYFVIEHSFEIQDNVPIPSKEEQARTQPDGRVVYPFGRMEAGQSFLVPLPAGQGKELGRVLLQRIRHLASVYAGRVRATRGLPRAFHTALTEGGIRVWRIE